MSAPELKPAAPADLDWIAALARSRPFSARWSRKAFAEELARTDSLFLALDGGRGYALARVVAGEAALLDLVVSVDGKGLGRALFDGLKAAAKARGCARITFEVSSANARALRFYEAAGAKTVGRRPGFYGDGSDAVLMDAPAG